MTFRGVEVHFSVFLTAALEGEWSASRPGSFISGKGLPVPIA